MKMKDRKCHLAVLICLITVLFVSSVRAQNASVENRQNAAVKNEDENIPSDRITIHQLKRKMDAKEDIVIIDTRKGSSYGGSTVKIKGAIHITDDELEVKMKDLPKGKEIITYCT